MSGPLLAALGGADGPEALRVGDRALSWQQLRAHTAGLAAQLAGASRVAVWATATVETCVSVAAAVCSGVPAVPVNPAVGEAELAHVVTDSRPEVVLAAAGETLPPALAGVRRIPVELSGAAPSTGLPAEPADDELPALVIYTSGTTGAPKGAVLSRRAVAANLDALALAWEWGDRDRLCHALPLFHVHGLVLGVLGPLRLGGRLHHLGRFSTGGLAGAVDSGATMAFGVPTMWSRMSADPTASRSLRPARLLVSGSAALPQTVHERLAELSGQRLAERYGMTETLINTAVRASGERRPGQVGPALPGVELRVVPEDGEQAEMGELMVRGPNLFSGYLNRAQATAEATTADGWFRTGDMGTLDTDGYLTLVGRRATDLIKSAGYKIGAGEVEGALLAHPAVAEVAVRGEPDDDLGERVVGWVVRQDGATVTGDELVDHVARALAPHKRPRVVRFVDALPRNALGKVVKQQLS